MEYLRKQHKKCLCLVNQNHAFNAWFVRPLKGLLPAASQDTLNDSSFAYYAPLPVNR